MIRNEKGQFIKTSIKKNCINCGKEFKAYPSALKRNKGKYCSKKCYSEFSRTRIVKKCLICGKEFFTYSYWIKKGEGKYCSKKCYGQSQYTMKTVKCLVCGKEFLANASRVKKDSAKYCSSKCWHTVRDISGNKHPNWKGGKVFHSLGYASIYTPKHPSCNKAGYVFEHRLVMEKHLRRYLNKKEVVHHINKIVSDNHIENLMLFPDNTSHCKYHRENPL